MKQIEILKQHCEFKSEYDTYVLLGISRKKDTPELTNSKEIVFREVLRKSEDIDRKYQRLKLNCENFRTNEGKKLPFYIYITMNARDARRSIRLLLSKINDCLYEEMLGNDRSRILKRIDREFISSLMKKESRSFNTKYFLIDVDTKIVNFNHKVEDILITYDAFVFAHETRHGYHIKTKPFNIQEFNKNFTQEELDNLVDVKPDGLLFVEYVKND